MPLALDNGEFTGDCKFVMANGRAEVLAKRDRWRRARRWPVLSRRGRWWRSHAGELPQICCSGRKSAARHNHEWLLLQGGRRHLGGAGRRGTVVVEAAGHGTASVGEEDDGVKAGGEFFQNAPWLAGLVESGALVRLPRRRFGPVSAWRPPDFVEPEESVADVERFLRAVQLDDDKNLFRAARRVSEDLGAQLVLGDRPIEITLERAWKSLSWDQKTNIVISLFRGITSTTETPQDGKIAVSPYELYEKLSTSYPSLLQQPLKSHT
uniref:Uncharacterized protein n=1 Tax=Setaria viridis TaxID=4556 RepID=A0A4U6U8S9_SETVI|nr:LOW QUALITY PROTEIN: hypothetical protein SEVIR_6G241600v2 [Setaria viridis]